jgi:hypothetical protein
MSSRVGRTSPRSTASALASPAAEGALFEREVASLGALESFDDVAKAFEDRLTAYQAHAAAFWGLRAASPVPWRALARLSSAGGARRQHTGAEKLWKKAAEAAAWAREWR